jgi:outer membrane protein assembly factor BamB
MGTRAVFALAFVAAAAAAQAPDAAAPPGRWSDPRGTAAGSHASRALPILGDVEAAWRLALPGSAAGAPVHWDGVAWLLCLEGMKRSPLAVDMGTKRVLIALDLATGKERARKSLPPGPLTPPVVWDGLVLVALAPNQLMGYSLDGNSIAQRWKPDPLPAPMSVPVIAEGDVWFIAGGALQQLPLRKRTPKVVALDDFRGRPAVSGDLVFALRHGEVPGYEPSLHLSVYDRRTHECLARPNVAWYAGGLPGSDADARITVTPTEICVEGPAPFKSTDGQATWAILSFRLENGRIAFPEPAGLSDFLVPPSAHAQGLLALGGGEDVQWHLWKPDEKGRMRGAVLAEAKDRPDLFRHRLPATVVGGIAYFGSWAADFETGDILWYLPVEDPQFAAVPADRLVLVVDGTTLVAFREAKAP